MSALGIYDLGTITVDPGDTLVAGTGVAWATIGEFDLLVAGGACAFVDAVTDLVSYDELRLKGAWRGPALAGAPYQIVKFPADWTRTQQEVRDLLNLLRLGARVYVVPAGEAAPDAGIGEPGDTAIQVTQWPPAMWTKSGAGAWEPVAASSAYLFPAGSAALPSIAFAGDPDTGMWSPAAGTIAWSTGGVERMRLDSAGLNVASVKTSVIRIGSAPFISNFVMHLGTGANIALIDSNAAFGGDHGVCLYAYNDTNDFFTRMDFVGTAYRFHNSGDVLVANTTVASSTTTGALVVSGGMGVGGGLFAGGNITTAAYVRANGFVCRAGVGGAAPGHVFNVFYNSGTSQVELWVDSTKVGNITVT